MKVDDDTFVNLPKLYHLLTEDKRFKNLKELLLGRCFCGSPRVFKVLSLTNVVTNKAVIETLSNKCENYFIHYFLQVKPETKYTDKWQVPTYMYNGDNYPSILSGSGYVLSRAAASCIYQEALKIPYFHLEVFYTKSLMKENITP